MDGIFVIGMGRSGTSLATRLLEIAGAYVGTEETLLAANEWNETGFWEDKRIASLNARLLEAFGGRYWDPPLFPADWLEDERVLPFRAEAKALLETDFFGHPLWAVKDPRVTVVLPFWQSLVDQPKHILCLRNPMDAAASLSKRDRMPMEFSVAIWHVYTLRALVHTNRENRFALFYEDVMSDPLKAAEPLFAFIGAEDRLSDPNVRAEIEHSVRTDLKHYGHNLQAVMDCPYMLGSTKSLYRAFIEGDDEALEAAVADSPQTLQVLYAITRACGSMFDLYSEAFRLTRRNDRKARMKDAANPVQLLRNLFFGRPASAAGGWAGRSSRRLHASE